MRKRERRSQRQREMIETEREKERERERKTKRGRETLGNEPLHMMQTSPSSTHLRAREREGSQPPDAWETGTRRALL